MIEIPVCIFIFKRGDLAARVVDKIKEVKPRKVYICADGPRNDNEYADVQSAREQVLERIDWDCELICRFQEKNIGVLNNLGKNMLDILSIEESCIFLEEDNLPSKEFFFYCQDMLEKYRLAENVLWVCGTNYIDDFQPDYEYDISFTQHHFPCGFATWGEKFTKYYKLDNLELSKGKSRFFNSFTSKLLAYQEWISQRKTEYLLEHYPQKTSWDRQMQYVIRSNELFGIIPKKNFIENIGVDERSTHGGVSTKITMTRKFCSTPMHQDFKVRKLPLSVVLNKEMELSYEKFFIKPFGSNIKIFAALILKLLTFKKLYKPNFLEDD